MVKCFSGGREEGREEEWVEWSGRRKEPEDGRVQEEEDEDEEEEAED